MKNDNYNFVANTRAKSKEITDQYENVDKLLGFLGQEIATVKQTLQTYRTINHWNTAGLLSRRGKDEAGWRKFSIADLFWINVIDSLRTFGYPIEKIKIVKRNLFGKSSETNNLNKYILDTLLLEGDWNLLIHADGEVVFQDKLVDLNEHTKGNFIRINLYEVLEKILGNKDIDRISPTLDRRELSLLLEIRKGDFKEIVVKLNNGKIERFDTKEDVNAGIDAFQTIKELLKGEDFQDVLIKKQGGKIVSIEQKKKSKGDTP